MEEIVIKVTPYTTEAYLRQMLADAQRNEHFSVILGNIEVKEGKTAWKARIEVEGDVRKLKKYLKSVGY